MQRLIVAAAAILLMTGIGTAGAKPSGKKGVYNSAGQVSQRPVRLRSEPTRILANPDLKYGPYPEYPQSPPGGGY